MNNISDYSINFCRKKISLITGESTFDSRRAIQMAQDGTQNTFSFAVPIGINLRTRKGWQDLYSLFELSRKPR